MAKEFAPNLLTVESPDGTYANAFIALGLIYTANHVVDNPSQQFDVVIKASREKGSYFFQRVGGRDVARSHCPINDRGFECAPTPRIGEEIIVVGFHGPKRRLFKIAAKVTSVLANGCVVVEKQRGQKDFQVGMSGSAGLTRKGELVGLLTRKAGEGKVLLEPIH